MRLWCCSQRKHIDKFCWRQIDILSFVSDAASAKIGKFLPGSRIPILEPEAVFSYRPDYLVIFPWNIASEVKAQFSELGNLGSKFITFVPELRSLIVNIAY